MSVLNPDNVTFSAKTQLKIGVYGTARAALAYVGLLGKDITFNIEQTLRTKKDGYPEVVVAQAIMSQAATMDVRLREWNKNTILYSLGLNDADIAITVGGDVVLAGATGEMGKLRGDVGALRFPRKLVASVTVKSADGLTTYAAGADYLIVDRDLENRTIIVRNTAGAMNANQPLRFEYTYTQSSGVQAYDIGKNVPVRYRSVELVEDLTNGGQIRLYIPKAQISNKGGLKFFTDDSGAESEISITAVQDLGYPGLAILENQDPA